PRDADVFLVDADRVSDHIRIAPFAGHRRVEIANLAEAVAALLERVRHLAQAPLAGVEGIFPTVHRTGIAVGHDHLGYRGSSKERPHAATVFVGDGGEHETFGRSEAHPHRAVLPPNHVAFDGETRTGRLCDPDR